MIRIMLVDDEPFIRVAIKSLFPWEKHGFLITAEAGNGSDAILKLAQEDIDLLITDIKMPVTDGISLLNQVKTDYPHILCVVLSNYEDFDLTRRAFLAGAVDYLLKGNLNEESFSALIQRLNNNYFKMFSDSSASQSAPVRPSFERKVLALQQLITGNAKAEAADTLKQELEIGSPFIVCSMKLLSNKLESGDPKPAVNGNEELIRNTVFKIISEISEFNLYYYAISTSEYILFIYNRNEDEDRFLRRLRAFYEQLTSNISIYLNKFSVIGTSQLRSEIFDLPISYREADMMSDQIFYCRESAQYFFTSSDNVKNPANPVRKFVLSHIEIIPLWIREQNWDSLRAFFDEFIVLLENSRYPPAYSKRIITNLEFLIINELSRNFNNSMGNFFDYDTLFDATMRSLHVTKLEQIISNFLNKIKKAAASLYLHDAGYSDIVHHAIVCLQKHYRDPETSLSSIAEEISVNPSYLSRIFHRETGRTFNTYLNFLRMEHAKKLLRTTNDSIVAVSEKSGYNNSKYFINLFKKTEGLSPSAYRNAPADSPSIETSL